MKFLGSKGFNEKEVAEKIKNNEELKLDEESKFGYCMSICLVNFALTKFISYNEYVLYDASPQPKRFWRA